MLIDLLGGDGIWADWSSRTLARYAIERRIVTGPIVLAELARYAEDARALAQIPDCFGIAVEDWSIEASLRAGHAFQRHVGRTGRRGAVLADFLIGGHAEALGAAVLTRDPKLLRRYFPDLALVTPV